MTSERALSCDILVIGAGPAGIAAAVTAAERGANVAIVDDNPLPGGQIWRAKAGETIEQRAAGSIGDRWLRRLAISGARLLGSTRVVACLNERSVLAESDDGSIEVSFRQVILANGARELLLPFPGWTLPNVFAAGGLQALVKSGFFVEGKRIVVAGTGPLLFAVAAFLKSRGAVIVGVYEQTGRRRMTSFAASMLARPRILKEAGRYMLQLIGVPSHFGWWPVSAQGDTAVTALTLTNGSRRVTVACDLVACGFHLVPNTELQSAFGCRLEHGKTSVDTSQRTSVENVFSVGEATGIGGLDLALAEGQLAALVATDGGTQDLEAGKLFRRRKRLEAFARIMQQTFALRPEVKALCQPETIVCRCEDVPWSEIRRQGSARSARLHTRCGMGACQGRICGAALGVLSGWPVESTRPPIYPVRLSTLVRVPKALPKE